MSCFDIPVYSPRREHFYSSALDILYTHHSLVLYCELTLYPLIESPRLLEENNTVQYWPHLATEFATVHGQCHLAVAMRSTTLYVVYTVLIPLSHSSVVRIEKVSQGKTYNAAVAAAAAATAAAALPNQNRASS